MKYTLNTLALLILVPLVFGQNTVGVLRNDMDSYDGYTFFSPIQSKNTYLINNCGEIVHQWSTNGKTGSETASAVYLLENGNILRTSKIDNADITFGGVGGKLEIYDWDNNLIWEYTYSTPQKAQHHEAYPLPNGNILMLAVTTLTNSEAIEMGRKSELILDGKLFNEQIIELQPDLTNGSTNVVWEWNIKDHLIQDFDATKSNYGVVSEHPELLNINYLNQELGHANWLHINSLQYNSTLDQILLSSRLLDEFYIIDHSTTTEQAASHNGGIYGKGGDFLYRWGNPEAYNHGNSNDKTLYSQHYPHWIPEDKIDGGKILIFNNGNARRYSSVDIVSPTTTAPGFYNYETDTGFGPTAAEWSYTAPNPEDFFSSILSSAQRLPNGNTLICDGDSGYFFEIDSSNNIVWEYINPDTTNGILSQGETSNSNLVFRAFKYPKDYVAFSGKDLTPGNPIELMPNLDNCSLLSVSDVDLDAIEIFPNPTTGILKIKTNNYIENVSIYNILGNLVKKEQSSKQLDITELPKGIYFIKLNFENNSFSKKIIKS